MSQSVRLGNGFVLIKRATHIRIIQNLDQFQQNIIHFDFTNPQTPNDSRYRFRHVRTGDNNRSSVGRFYSDFSPYVMTVLVLEDDNTEDTTAHTTADIQLTDGTHELFTFAVPPSVAQRIIQFGVQNTPPINVNTFTSNSVTTSTLSDENNLPEGGRRRYKSRRRRTMKRKN